jgi:hypothetical protein
MRQVTPYHARYFAHELTKRSSSESIESLTSALADARVDLNPHQIEAALFAFRCPLSRGAILADEVGLSKTIEAGILISQRWAKRRRKLLVICPASESAIAWEQGRSNFSGKLDCGRKRLAHSDSLQYLRCNSWYFYPIKCCARFALAVHEFALILGR